MYCVHGEFVDVLPAYLPKPGTLIGKFRVPEKWYTPRAPDVVPNPFPDISKSTTAAGRESGVSQEVINSREQKEGEDRGHRPQGPNNPSEINSMDVMGSSEGPSRLKQLLTAGNTDRRSGRCEPATASAEGASMMTNASYSTPGGSGGAGASGPVVASASGTGVNTTGANVGDGGSSSTDSTSEKSRNHRKRRHTPDLSSLPQKRAADKEVRAAAETTPSEEAEKIIIIEGNPETANSVQNDGPVALKKVAPIRLKKCYPSAVQSAECEEFLVSLSEEHSHISNESQEAHTTIEEGPNDAKDGSVKSKSDQEVSAPGHGAGIDTDQIEKLLSMPSPTSWKTSRRQRKFQCNECPKSYSSEDDLKSHVLSHSKGNNTKLFGCDHCDKRFKWIATLKAHMRTWHAEKSSQNGIGDENGIEAKDSPPKAAAETESKMSSPQSDPSATSTAESIKEAENQQVSAAAETNKSFTSICSDIVAKNGNNSKIDTHILPRRNRLELAKEETASRSKVVSSTIKKKYIATAKKVKNNSTKVVPTKESTKKAEEQMEPEAVPVPVVPATGRSALRRNIQRPKWLTDTDLVTDYEFPSGTKSSRMGSSSSPSSSTSSTVTSAKTSKTDTRRSISVESTNEKQSSSTAKPKKVDKVISRPSRENSRKTESNTIERNTSPEKPTSSKRLGEDEAVQEEESNTEQRSKRQKKATPPVTKSTPNKRRQENQSNSHSVGDSATTQQQLQAQLLTLSLNTIAEKTIGKNIPNIRKRLSTEIRTGNDNQSNETEKRMKTLDTVVVNSDSEVKSKSKSRKPNKKSGSKQIVKSSEDAVTKDAEKTEENVVVNHSKPSTDGRVVSKNRRQGIPPAVLADGKGKPKSSNEPSDTLDLKKIEKATVQVPEHGNPNVNNIQEDSQNAETNQGTNAMTDSNNSCAGVDEMVSRNENLPCILEDVKYSDQLPAVDGLNSMDVAETGDEETTCEKMDSNEHEVMKQLLPNSSDVKNDAINTTINATSNTTSVSVVQDRVPVTGNDEEMPILKPETTTFPKAAAESVSGSASELSKSSDGEETSNSSHSACPYRAPLLSKELESAAKNADTVEESTLENTVDRLNEMPLVDEDNEMVPSRRYRSDSMSVRSYESGTPSEKLKALDDTNTIDSTKDKETNTELDNECLEDDSDGESNDTLMSEFSELAAQVSERTDSAMFKEDCLRFLALKISPNSMWAIRKELKLLKKNKNYFKFGKLSPLAAGLMHDIFCQSLE